MAPLKLIAAIVAVLSAIVLEPTAGMDLRVIAEKMDKEWLIFSSSSKPEDVYLFAENYLTLLQQEGVSEADQLLKAWDRVLHEPDLCDESSLRYIATISRCYPEDTTMMKTLDDATKKYASKCLTLDDIRDKVKSQASAYSLKSRFNNITEFIDDQVIADYWSENSKDRSLNSIELYKASKSIAKAITRDSKNNITDLVNATQVHAYLKSRLYNPCSDYQKAFEDLDRQILFATSYWKGGYMNLISSLDKDARNALFRYKLCGDDEISSAAKDLSYRASWRVVSDMRNP